MFTQRIKYMNTLCQLGLLAGLLAQAPAALSQNTRYYADDLQAQLALPYSNNQWQLAQASISKSQAASRARSRYGGKVLSVRRSDNTYRVKLLLDSGKVIFVAVDARTGKVSKR